MAQVEKQVVEEQKADSSASKEMAKFIFEKIAANDLHISRRNGVLESRFHFGFARWKPKDRKRRRFGALHVMNDDIVEPKKGFGSHPHSNQEIFSYILSGELTHQDNENQKEPQPLGRGAVQYMSAGTGVWHSEMNEHEKDQVRFIQTWIYPNKKNLEVEYGSYKGKLADRHNTLFHMISGETDDGKANSNSKTPIRLHQDVNVYVSELDFGKSVQYELKEGRQAYLVCPEGSVSINDAVELETRAAVRLYGAANLNIVAKGQDAKGPSAHIMMIEMEQEKK